MYVRFYSEASIMMIDYENGELDCCIGLGINDTERVLEKGSRHSNMKIISSGSYTVLCLPAYNNAFSDPRVREAIACAIDTDKAAKAAYEALGSPMDKYVSSMANFSNEYKTDKYDPDKAKKLLEEAGYKKGDLQLYTVVSSSSASEIALAEIVQGFLQEIGVTLKIDSYDYPTALAMQRNGTVSLCMTTFFTMNGDISGCLIQLPKGSYNKGAWLTQDYPELGEKLDEGRYAKTDEEAQEAYTWVQDWLDENNWEIPIVEYNTAFICRDYVDDSGFYNLMYARDIRNLDFK
jgi:peptide/nickel transport system substrate-binding protein